MIKLLVCELSENSARDFSIERDILGTEFEVNRLSYSGNVQELLMASQQAEVILTDYVPFTRDILAQLTHCELISVSATGFNCIDVDAAINAGISVCAIDEYCTNEVADHTLTLILALSRRLINYHQLVQQDKAWQFDAFSGLNRLSELTLGIIGFGKIGQAVARRAMGFGLKIIAFDTYAKEEAAKELGVSFCDKDYLYANSDIISLHCNLGPDNLQFLDKSAFQKMSKKPVLINVARGELINEPDLVEALNTGLISAAGLDVLSQESPNISTSQLAGRDNVNLTPHVAYYSDASQFENRSASASDIRHHVDGNHESVRKYIHFAKNKQL